MYNSGLSIRITSLYGFQPSSVGFESKTVTFREELELSMGRIPHLSICACKTARFASELLFSMGPSPHVWFLDAKHRLLDQSNKSPWVPGLTCHFVHAKQGL